MVAHLRIFSLGTVLYEMLTGQPPFSGDNARATMYQVSNKDPPAPSSCSPHLPRELDPIVARAMAKDPVERYQSAAEMAADLRRLADLTAVTLPAGKLPEPLPISETTTSTKGQPAQRFPLWRYGAALVLFCLLGGATYLLFRASVPTDPTQIPAVDNSPVAGARPASDTCRRRKGIRPRIRQWKNGSQCRRNHQARRSPKLEGRAAPDLRACDELSAKKVVCIEKARWKHCPGHWGTIDDCPSSAGEQKP